MAPAIELDISIHSVPKVKYPDNHGILDRRDEEARYYQYSTSTVHVSGSQRRGVSACHPL
jgi:hypothetical protein